MVPGITRRSASRGAHPTSLSYRKKQTTPPCRKTECYQPERCPEGRQAGVWELGGVVG